MSNDRFRFRVWDQEDKLYTSFPWFAEIHNSRLEVEYPKILEQCTGLKDKNGRLIFEGDVVSDMGIEAVVGWYSDKYMIEYDDGSIGELAIAAEALEIIGNIHDEHFREVTKMVEIERN
jgi:hypothetical protein